MHTDEPAPDDSDTAAEPGIVGPLVADRDGDGFTIASDCDDDDATVFPGAPDVCGDGIRSDCGVGPPCRYEGEWSLANAHRIEGTRKQEGAAAAIVGVGDTNGDGLADFLSTAAGGDGTIVVLGPAPISTFEEGAAILREATSFTTPPVGPGDLDEDGYDDVLVLTKTGWRLVRGPFSGSMSVETNAAASMPFAHDATGLGDWNGDGHPDLALTWYESVSVSFGVFAGPFTGNVSSSDAVFLSSGSTGGQVDGVFGPGDVDADGLEDLVAVSGCNYRTAACNGASWLFYGGQEGYRATEEADAVLVGVNEEEEAGFSYDAAGDVNADGYDDILIGSFARDMNWGYRVNQTAVASLVYGPVYGHLDLDKADARYECDVEPVSCAVAQVRGAGDMDGDGFDDFAVSNPVGWRRDGSHGGAWLFYGPVEGHHTLDVADAALVGDVPVTVGETIDGVGDLDGDGLDDLVLGAPWWRESAESTDYDLGAAYIVFGGAL